MAYADSRLKIVKISNYLPNQLNINISLVNYILMKRNSKIYVFAFFNYTHDFLRYLKDILGIRFLIMSL